VSTNNSYVIRKREKTIFFSKLNKKFKHNHIFATTTYLASANKYRVVFDWISYVTLTNEKHYGDELPESSYL